MGVIGRSLILSVLSSVSSKLFFEMTAAKRCWRHDWVSYTMVPFWTAGYLMIAFTEIPPYILQPVRLIAVTAVGAGIYFRVTVRQNLLLSVFFSVLVWWFTLMVIIILDLLPISPKTVSELAEWIIAGLLLGLLLLVYRRHGDKTKGGFFMPEGEHWSRFFWFPVICLFSLVTFSAMRFDSGSLSKTEVFTACAAILLVNAAGFYFMGNMLAQETKLQKLELMQERTENQMRLYENMKRNYDNQRRSIHDYKNQLDCIQGLIAGNHIEEASAYIEKLGGTIRKSSDHVNTNHAVVNVVLNQKYEYAVEKGITMIVQVNDLSGLVMNEQDIVAILVNLLDNAVEACEKLEDNRFIRFKMILEGEQLILSVKNPVKAPVEIWDNTAATTKKDKKKHGIGLWNIRLTVEKNKGTCVLRCEDGWFYFSAVIPNA